MTAHGERRSGSAGADIRAAKDELRRRVLAARRAVPADVRAARAAALATAAVELAARVRGPICAYVPFGTEPGSVALLEQLHAAGHELLLPLVTGAGDPMDWARFTTADALAAGRLGIREPTGSRLGPTAIATAGLVLVPALAADRAGVRLGRGRGHYDRSLPLAAASARLVVVLDDDELLDRVPAEPHDQRVGAALLPGAGLVRLGNTS